MRDRRRPRRPVRRYRPCTWRVLVPVLATLIGSYLLASVVMRVVPVVIDRAVAHAGGVR